MRRLTGTGRGRGRLTRVATGAVALLIAASVVPFAGDGAGAAPGRPAQTEGRARTAQLDQCRHVPRARCGSIKVPFDRLDPSMGKLRIRFEVFPRRDLSKPLLGTIVAVEGGPGYASTASRAYYLDLFGPLMDRRRLLLVDNRGTGRSGVIMCGQLQAYLGDYPTAAGRCGRKLGEASDIYGSGNAADDLAAVLDHLGIEKVDLYGDSYGTFFSQTFAVRHPDRLRSLMLDAAYFVGATDDPFWSDTNRAIRFAFRMSCERSPACASRPGNTMRRIARLARRLRRSGPIKGRAPNADGDDGPVKVGVDGLINIVVGAGYTTTLYRELDAAIRAALREHPYNRPLLRLARETYWEGGAGPVRQYSEGLYMAVACNDYPQAYDMTDPVDQRPEQYQATLQNLRQTRPGIFAPFTVREWVTSPVEYFESCIKWPVASRVDPPIPAGATFPDVPTLVLAGDLDSVTSPEGARRTADAFPDSTYVEVANMTHVAALTDYGHCASTIVRRFVRSLDAGNTSCASRYNEVRLVDKFARSVAGLDQGGARFRTARVAAATLGDVLARWFQMYGYSGVGLRGGTFEVTGQSKTLWRNLHWRLQGVQLVSGVKVSGKMHWNRASGRVHASVEVAGEDASPGRLKLRWNYWHRRALARASGNLGGVKVRFQFPAS